MIIAIDIGNTNILFGKIDTSGNIIEKLRIKTKDFFESLNETNHFFAEKLNNFITNDCTKFILSGVVPCVEEKIKIFLSNKFQNIDQIEINNSILSEFINIDVNLPDEVGADRLINAIATLEIHKPPLIIVDLGTATTFDIISKDGSYIGGLICPGVDLSIQSLAEKTAKLPLIKFKKTENIIGKDTKSAIESGIYWGYVSLIEGIIDKLKSKEELNSSTVIATGGLSDLFKNNVKSINHFIQDLTLMGLNSIYRKLYDS